MTFKERAYQIGMKNGWCSGLYEMQDGGFVSEEDRLNKNSISEIKNIEKLKEFFKNGNWCLGQGVIYKNLCFIQQVNGGDEWLTIKDFPDGAIDFESITFKGIIKRGEFEAFIKRLQKASKDQCKHLKY